MSDNRKIQMVAVIWQKRGYVAIEADSMEEAMKKFEENPDAYRFSENGEYTIFSHSLASQDVREMEMLAKDSPEPQFLYEEKPSASDIFEYYSDIAENYEDER